MPENLAAAELRELLHTDPSSLREALSSMHERDIAEMLEPLEDAEIWTILRLLEPPLDAEVLSHLEPERQSRILQRQEPQEAAAVLEHMAPDDRTDIVQGLDREMQQQVLGRMSAEDRREVEQLGTYAEDTAGAVMSSEVTALKADLTVAQAVEYLREMAEQRETIYYNYVVDEHDRLKGIVSLRDLVLAQPEVRLSEVMNPEVITVRAEEDREEVARKIREYDLLALPVVDDSYRLLGLVTVDDVMDVAEEEATEDIHKIGGSSGLIRTSLREAGVTLLYRKRIPWLLVLVFINIFAGAGIAFFEETIEAMVALVFFLPLLIDSGGNAGSQAATLMVRALATGDVRAGDWLRLLGKEIGVALALGVTMGVGVALIASFRAPEVLAVVAVSMVIIVVIGSLIGMLLPFLLTRAGLDPATASAPLITSLADISGVLVYFAIATWWLGLGGQVSGNGV